MVLAVIPISLTMTTLNELPIALYSFILQGRAADSFSFRVRSGGPWLRARSDGLL